MSKAQQVRELIAEAKSQGRDAVWVIPAVMALGFKRQLARAYINNNWAKVTATAAPAVVAVPAESKPAKQLSQSRDAIRKREARAAKRAAVEAAVAA